MNSVLVLISISTDNLEKIKLNPELQQLEIQYINQWKEDGILENFFITVSKSGAVLIFKNIDEANVRQHIEILPYFPFMSVIEYFNLNKQF